MNRTLIPAFAGFLFLAVGATAQQPAQPPLPPGPPPPPEAPAREARPMLRAQLGIAMGRVDESLATHLNVNPDEVVLIVDVAEGGPAAEAGVKRFDVITHIEGKSHLHPSVIREIIMTKKPGDTLSLRVLRAGQPLDLNITLREAPEPGELFRWPRSVTQRILEPEGAGPETEDVVLEHALRFQREWFQRQQEARPHVERLREEARRFRRAWDGEWRAWSEEHLDEEGRMRLRRFLETAAERASTALERAAEALEKADVEIEVRAPRIELFREGGGVRGMVVRPHDQQAREIVRDVPLLAEVYGAQRADSLEHRMERLENRLERIERMLQRLEERESRE
jgi:hypothetical protein